MTHSPSRIAFLAISALLLTLSAHAGSILNENFDSFASLAGKGWLQKNNSAPQTGGNGQWGQGSNGYFAPQAGPDGSFAVDTFTDADPGGNISDWLITPTLTYTGTTELTFYTRVDTGSIFPDRLEVRFSPTGGSNVGTTASSVGDFTTLLLTINPNLTVGGYPDAWTAFTIELPSSAGVTTGRVAFRYDVTDTNANGNFIGLDSIEADTVPEPGTIVGLLTGLGALWARRRKA